MFPPLVAFCVLEREPGTETLPKQTLICYQNDKLVGDNFDNESRRLESSPNLLLMEVFIPSPHSECVFFRPL